MRTRTRVVVGGLAALVIIGAGFYLFAEVEPPGSGGVTGKCQMVDDTGLGNSTIGEGTFLVIPGVTVQDVWPEVENHEGRLYPDLGARTRDVTRAADEFGAVLVEVQPNGLFRINVAPGPAVVCLMGSGGCVEVTLPESGTVNAYRSEGGFDFG